MVNAWLRVAIVLLALCVSAGRATAVFFPAVQRPSREELQALEEEREPSYWSWPSLGKAALDSFAEFVGALALSVDYVETSQDVVANAGAAPMQGETRLKTTSARPEIVWTNWLSTYGLFAMHRGDNTSGNLKFDLDGWAAGAGATLALGLPAYTPRWDKSLTFDPLFVAPDFNWTRNEFNDVKDTVNVYNVTTRIGAAVRTNRLYYGLYAGPQYQTSTKDQAIRFGATFVDVEAKPAEAWSGVVGSFFGVMFEKDEPAAKQDKQENQKPRRQRPDLMVTMEGGVGNRHGFLVSLRYEHNIFQYIEECFKKPS